MSGTKSGTVLSGRYRLIEQVGKGGMGSVWVAEDDKLQRQVAVKIMSKQIATDGTAQARFEREAKAVAGLRSTHIVQVHDYGIDDRQPFMVMELLEGRPLSTRLRGAQQLRGEELRTLAEQLAKALQTAHESGIVHRDLKPANVFLVRDHGDQIVKVIDFGIAKALGRTTRKLTADHDIIGTPQYMSPEQLRADEHIDTRADLWSFGCILFRATTGALPFSGHDMMDLVGTILDEPAQTATSLDTRLPETIDAFFERALAKDKEQRFDSALQMAEAFGIALGQPAAGKSAAAESLEPAAQQPSSSAASEAMTAIIPDPDSATTTTSPGVATTISDSTTRVMPRPPATPRRPLARYAGILAVLAIIGGLLAFRFGTGSETSATQGSAAAAASAAGSSSTGRANESTAHEKMAHEKTPALDDPGAARSGSTSSAVDPSAPGASSTSTSSASDTPPLDAPSAAGAASATSRARAPKRPPAGAAAQRPPVSSKAGPGASSEPAADSDLFDAPW